MSLIKITKNRVKIGFLLTSLDFYIVVKREILHPLYPVYMLFMSRSAVSVAQASLYGEWAESCHLIRVTYTSTPVPVRSTDPSSGWAELLMVPGDCTCDEVNSSFPRPSLF